ncbi:hypothetical protein [Roseateles oligotrophus]|uniref:Uncharacterized protein n=1 Tax=Roseateles oligotrophus TaxID=1769250 RepID=A0ABT2YKF7_9BURK|nr:hypothetical protein [Roseateles oligotrophus]MCV2370544.1 hypothetical protein [Roseateles oligotrophus]
MNDSDDPLWLNSPIKLRIFRASCYLLVLSMGIGLMWAITGSVWGALAGATAAVFCLASAQQWIPNWIEAVLRGAGAWQWRHREGVHYNFAGVSLDVYDDGHHIWLHERGLRELLALERDPAQAFKARFTGQWRETHELGLKGVGLWLNVAAVHQHLAEARERMDPKRLKLRAYLDREILQPAAKRRERGL